MSACAVMLPAAGRGMRMRPLSDARPKPLLLLNGGSLIESHLRRLAKVCERAVINERHPGPHAFRDFLTRKAGVS